MKPHEISGVTFENLAEISHASHILNFAAGLNQFPEKTQAELQVIATAVSDYHPALEALAPLQGEQGEASLTINRLSTAHIVLKAIDLTISLHPDELLCAAAHDMRRSYQAAQNGQEQ